MTEVDKYFAQFPKQVKEHLNNIRRLIFEMAPGVEEKMAYGMPAYHLNKKPLIYYAAYQNHIGLYALPVTNLKFEKHLKEYKCGKGSIQLPVDQPMPYDLIKRIILFRVEESKSNKSKLKRN
jgi:uncharacterized protein YdhG (YjbR/CyaY superfamily)